MLLFEGPDVFRFRHQLFTSTENDGPCRTNSTPEQTAFYPDAQRLSGYTAHTCERAKRRLL